MALHSKDASNLNATLAHIACENSDLVMLKLLREKYRVDLDAQDKEEATPLFYACRQGNLEIIKYLDSQGVNLEHREFQDRTAVYA